MDIITYALCKKYTDKIADSLGSLKGAPCTIKQTEELENGVQVTFEWTGYDGIKETTSIFVPAGPVGPTGLQGPQGDKGDAGIGIEKIEKVSAEGLIDTYKITFTDGVSFDFTVTNGKDAVVDSELSETSENAIQNKAVTKVLNDKFDSNQGILNAGKVLGTNANGEVIPLNGYGFEYNEETQMLEYGTDPTTNLNQGIGLDDTLSKKGYAAEASAVGELKSDLDYQNENISNGEGKIFEYASGRTHITDYDRSLCTMSAEAPKAMYGNGFTADDDLLLTKIHIDANTIRVLVNTIDNPNDWTVYSDLSVTNGVASVSIPVKKGQSVFVGWQDGTVQYSPNISGLECVAYINYQSNNSKITINALASFNLEYSYYDKTEWYDLGSHIYRKYKTWLAVGDSITVGETNNRKSYVDYISETLKITAIKEGHSGWSFSRLVQNFASFDIDNSADIITIFAGTSDFNKSKGAGTETDKWTASHETIWALCNYFMPYIQKRYPTKPIIFFTPIQRQYHGEDASSITTMTDANGVTLQEYAQAFIDAGKKYGIPVIDLYSVSGIGVNNINEMTNDGLHPNEIGQKRIANIILSEIMKYTQIN